MIAIVQLHEDGRCNCSCGDACPLGKTGSAARCTREELHKALVWTLENSFDRETTMTKTTMTVFIPAGWRPPP